MIKLFLIVVLIATSTLLMAKVGSESHNVDISKEFNDNVKKIDIDVNTEDLKIVRHNKSSIIMNISGYTSDKHINKTLEWGVRGNTFEIKSKKNVVIGFRRHNIDIVLYIPEKEFEELSLYTSTGDIESENLESQNIELKSSTGDKILGSIKTNNIEISSSTGSLTLKEIIGDKVGIKSTTGNIEVGNIFADYINISASTGDLRADNIVADEVSLTSSTGKKNIRNLKGDSYLKSTTSKTTIDNVSGDLNIKSTTGGIDINYEDFNNNKLIISSTIGDVTVVLNSDSEFKTKLSTSVGSLKCDFPLTIVAKGKIKDNKLEGSIGSGEGVINIDTTTGDIDLLSN